MIPPLFLEQQLTSFASFEEEKKIRFRLLMHSSELLYINTPPCMKEKNYVGRSLQGKKE